MRFLKMLLQVLILCGFVMLGNWLHEYFQLPFPGSIIGLVLLWAALTLKVIPLKWIESGAFFILSYLPLYFIPPIVGAINYGHIFIGKGLFLIFITIASTILTLIASGWISQILAKQSAKKKERLSCKL
ncbi:CidA/LrgA family protein [Sporosarcina sp. FA9]|uniref:CidA/LrgA family protein n=1 Tax=Sporosarcina sp. FA9 TaxID=3413030 RepID=UPI003F65F1A9